ncbi:hypothetical protein LZ30DRAFT_228029 [Colletotrichum cereale]|nr:hypothetical protein LZ30DRAFT_228029 [Colletotrichum cereale]
MPGTGKSSQLWSLFYWLAFPISNFPFAHDRFLWKHMLGTTSPPKGPERTSGGV